MNVKERVIINGFLLDVFVPSEERLVLRVDLSNMPKYTHVDWVAQLQDLLRVVDEAYRFEKGLQTRGRGRAVRVKYVRTGAGQNDGGRRIARFSPYPATIINELKELRRQVYYTLNRMCIILQKERVGKATRKVYFLPAKLAPDLMNELRKHNVELQIIRKEIVEFSRSPRFAELIDHAKKACGEVNDFSPNIPNISVNPVPLSLSRAFFEQYIEEERRKILTDVDEERKRGFEELQREIEAKRAEMVQAIERDLRQRFTVILEATEQTVKNLKARGSTKRLAKNFKSLMTLIENTGIEYMDKPFKALGEVLDALGYKDPNALVKSVGELAESLGVKPTGDPAKDIELATRTVKGKSVLLFTID